MPGRYTTKIRAKRIELNYFKRLHPLRRWRAILTIATPAVAAVALVALAARGDQRIYNSGPVSTGHAMFNTQCGQCHVPTGSGAAAGGGRGFWLRASDQACLNCHGGPIHHDRQSFDPPCATCHVEHKGHVVLASISSRHCTQCHADLKTKGASTGFVAHVDSFAKEHPEFAVTIKEGAASHRVRLDAKPPPMDAARLNLDHQKHLAAGLRYLDETKARRGMRGLVEGPRGLQLTCAFCHEPDGGQAYMLPVKYAMHCGPICHELELDEALPLAPHDTPSVVHAFVRGVYGAAFDACAALDEQAIGSAGPDLLARCRQLGLAKSERKAEDDDGRPRGRPGRREDPEDGERPRTRLRPREEQPDEAARPRGGPGRREEVEAKPVSQEWVPARVKRAESRVFKTCAECHALTAGAPGALPVVAPTAVPVRWLPHSRFDHGAHRPLGCAECHRAADSKRTEDVLLPSIATCRECHRDSGGARSGCVECHVYHDRAKARDLNGPLGIRDLLSGAPARRATAFPASVDAAPRRGGLPAPTEKGERR